MDQNKITRALGRIEGKLERIEEDISYTREGVDGLDERMRAVETRTAVSSGIIATAVAAGVSGIAHALGVPAISSD